MKTFLSCHITGFRWLDGSHKKKKNRKFDIGRVEVETIVSSKQGNRKLVSQFFIYVQVMILKSANDVQLVIDNPLNHSLK